MSYSNKKYCSVIRTFHDCSFNGVRCKLDNILYNAIVFNSKGFSLREVEKVVDKNGI